jgi:hypothetical protein
LKGTQQSGQNEREYIQQTGYSDRLPGWIAGRIRRMNIDRISYFITAPVHLLGLLFLIVAGISMWTGKTLTRGQGSVSRTEEPKTFWFIVAVFFLAA